ncbi:Pentatricopeptide repeat-containing protein [Sesamum angolense]|uniref:Pentatricopeptide repeat-containing protein n=1 Tax=Sesamum angolense TaxID=2727404 RepID=A0AAE1WCV1_9LAMI|nr:Pentatricopeptide repeat-containing protein [Sesamum angolense]
MLNPQFHKLEAQDFSSFSHLSLFLSLSLVVLLARKVSNSYCIRRLWCVANVGAVMQSIKQALDTQAQSKPQFNFDHKTIIGLHVKTDNYMVDCLLTTLKDFAGRDSLSSLLLSCTNFKLVSEGKQLHAQVITWGLQKNHALIPKLVSLYAAFGLLGDAHHVVTGSHILHPLPWNILISSYACAEQSYLDLGKEVHRSINASSVKWNLFVQNALVSMYGKCGDLETAQVFLTKCLLRMTFHGTQ